MIILGIESSCDETAASIVEGPFFAKASEGKQGSIVKVLSNVVASQIEIHQKYGGVVPEVAAREHVLNILPVVNEALLRARTHADFTRTNADLTRTYTDRMKSARVRVKSASVRGIDAVAVTVGPGLVTSLSVGVETAKVLSYVWKVPVIAVNHIEAHLYANFILDSQAFDSDSRLIREKIKFPALVLTVSGGHTILVLMSGHGKYKIIGETRDDAAGEAFDKAASLLGLGYPGGPSIAKEAIKIKNKNEKIKNIILPRPMLGSKNFEFSFSGLKTALLYQLKKDSNWQKRIPEYAYEFQRAVVETLVGKIIRAAKILPVKTIMLSGGVSANTVLREELKAETEKLGLNFLMPELKYTTDNAAMIATAGYFKARRKEYTDWRKLAVRVNWELA